MSSGPSGRAAQRHYLNVVAVGVCLDAGRQRLLKAALCMLWLQQCAVVDVVQYQAGWQAGAHVAATTQGWAGLLLTNFHELHHELNQSQVKQGCGRLAGSIGSVLP